MNKKIYLSQVIIAMFCMMCFYKADAQYLAPRVSVHITNPLSCLSKFGGRLQYRISPQNSILIGYRKYYGFFPGYQASGEFHRYFSTLRKSEAFFYGKFGVGNASYAPKPYFSGAEDPYGKPDGYLFAGAGVGKRFNMGHFFLEANAGLKFAQQIEKTDDYNKSLFYTLGPGSFFDCGIHIGFQFFNDERNMYRQTLAPRRPKRYR